MEIPIFNNEALSNLTQKIETSFKNSNRRDSKTSSKAKKAPTAHTHIVKEGEGNNGKKRTRDGKSKQETPGRKGNQSSSAPQAPSVRNPATTRKWSKPDVAEQRPKSGIQKAITPISRKLKHSERSVASQHNDQTASRTITKTSTNSQSSPSKRATRFPLQNELEALGGDEEDLQLIENAASDSEIEGSKLQKNDGQLAKELQKYAKDLGIQSAAFLDTGSASLSDGSSQDYGQDQGADHSETVMEVESQQMKKLDWKEERDVRRKVEKAAREKQPAAPVPSKAMPKMGSKGPRTIFTPQSEWHTVALPAIPVPSQISMPPKETVDQLQEYAVSLLHKDGESYAAYNNSASSAHQFYSTIMSSGTLSDRISALTLSVQESPVHNVKTLENLVSLARKRSRQQAVEVLGALKDLLGPGNLLPSDRKLRFFAMQPALVHIFEPKARWQIGDALPSSLKESHLIAWAYEDKLKSIYFEILQVIETWCNDEVVFARRKAVDYLFELLRDKPEQEANLLRLLVNKLGDSDKSIASKTSYDLLQLQNTHPAMRMTIISAIESDLLFRPGQSTHAKYYAIITLNQTVLSGRDEAIPKKLLDIYFTMFVTLLKKPEAAKETQRTTIQVKYNKKGERQGGGGAAGKKAQKKLADLEKRKTVDEELREKLLSAVLTGVNRAMPYAKTDDEAFDKHMDTLFRVTHSSNFNTSVQALMLIQQLCGSHQAASSRFYRTTYESLLDPRLLTSSKQAMYLNLLFRALRADLSVKRVKAFAKRLLQVVMMHQASFACGVIYLLRELESVFANLATFVDQPEDESDEEEEFRDVPEIGDSELPARVMAIKEGQRSKLVAYDGRKREPEYSNAERSCLWEITPFLSHYHPSVSLLASNILKHQPITAKPDLSAHTLIHFLDRFVYRNPKKPSSRFRGSSIMQPLESNDKGNLLLSAASKHSAKAPVNSESYWNAKSDVEADEVFFHKYFNTLGKGKSKKDKKAEKKRKDVEGGGSEAEEEEIWKALVESQPDLEMEESGSDLGFESLDEDEDLGKASDLDYDDESDGMAAGSDEGGVEFNFDEDDDALLRSEDEIDVDLNGEAGTGTGKKDEASEPRSKRRKRLKNLPTFASIEDYSELLNQEEGLSSSQ